MWFNDVGIKKWFPTKLNTRNSEIILKALDTLIPLPTFTLRHKKTPHR